MRAAVGTRQKPKMMRPTSCQVLLVRINHRAGDYGARSGPRWLRGRVFCSRPAEATGAGEPAPCPDSAFRSAFVPRGADLQGCRLRPPGPPLLSPARPRRRPPPPKSTALDSLRQRPGSRTPGPSRVRQNSSAIPSLYRIYCFIHRGLGGGGGGGTNFNCLSRYCIYFDYSVSASP